MLPCNSLYKTHFAIEISFFSPIARLCIITEMPEKEREKAIIAKEKRGDKIHKSDIYKTAFPTSLSDIMKIFAISAIGKDFINPHNPEKKEMKKITLTEADALLFKDKTKS